MRSMKLHVLSDVHLEFQRWRREWDIKSIDCDVNVIAGDAGIGLMGLQFALEAFSRPVIYVCGNHELYGQRTVRRFWEKARRKVVGSHVHLLENHACVIGGTRFLGSTLWSNFCLFGSHRQAEVGGIAQKEMTDFRCIYLSRRGPLVPNIPYGSGQQSSIHSGDRLTWRKEVEWHEAARQFLERELPRTGDWNKTVVVTHHSPSVRSVEEEGPDDLSAAYCSALDELVPLADLWIHGHVHQAREYSSAHGGRIVVNARGYADRGPDAVEGFQWDRIVTLE